MPHKPILLFALFALLCLGSVALSSGASFEPSTDATLKAEISERFNFPILPLGCCLEGSRIASRYLGDKPLIFGYDPGDEDYRGHVWLLVGDEKGGYQAVDSYYGLRSDPYYYAPPLTASTYDELTGLIEMGSGEGRKTPVFRPGM